MSQGLSDYALRAVGEWMDSIGLPTGVFTRNAPLGGGTQNIVMLLERAGRRYVLRRGPEHLRPSSNDVMRREMRLLSALANTALPHPRIIAGSPDGVALDGAAFYLMEVVEGFCPIRSLPRLHAEDAGIRYAMGMAAVDVAADLAALDHDSLGLADFGRPAGYLERQVPRWMAELDSYSRHVGWPGPGIANLDRVAAWLESQRPPDDGRAGLTHGDYHFANLLFRFDGPQVAAVVDWEMCTVGDPLVDLGWLLVTWPGNPGTRVGSGALAIAGGLPDRRQVIDRYAARSTRDLSHIAWYEVLACFRLGIILEGTHARACAGEASRRTGELLHSITLGLFAQAEKLMTGD